MTATLTEISNSTQNNDILKRISNNIQEAETPACRLSKVGVVRVGRFGSKLVRHMGTFGVPEAKATTLPKSHKYPVVLGPGTVFIRLQQVLHHLLPAGTIQRYENKIIV